MCTDLSKVIGEANENLSSEHVNDCERNPLFVTVCTFFLKFGEMCGLEKLNIDHFQSMIEFENNKIPQELVDFLIKVIRKVRNRSFPDDKWQINLVRQLKLLKFDESDLAKIEQEGLQNTDISCRLRVLQALTNGLFDKNQKLRVKIPALNATELKTNPLGVDIHGNVYWKTHDDFGNFRIFCENRLEDSWSLVSKSLVDYKELIDKLVRETKPPGAPDTPSEEDKSENESTQDDAVNCEKSADDDDRVGREKSTAMNGDGSENDITHIKTNDNVKVIDKSSVGNEMDSEEPKCSETIEEPVMIVTGEGSGYECDMENFAVLNRNGETAIVGDARQNGPDEVVEPDGDIEAHQSNNTSENLSETQEEKSGLDTSQDCVVTQMTQGESEQVESTAEKPKKRRKKRKRKFTPLRKTAASRVLSKTESGAEIVDAKKATNAKPQPKKKGRPHKALKTFEIKDSESDEPDDTEKLQLLQKLESNPLLRKIKSMGANLNDVETLKNISSVLDDSEDMIKPVRLSSRLAKIKIKEAVTPKKSVAGENNRAKQSDLGSADANSSKNNGEDDDITYISSDDKYFDSKHSKQKKDTKVRRHRLNQKKGDKKMMGKMAESRSNKPSSSNSLLQWVSTSSLSAKRKRSQNQKSNSRKQWSSESMSSIEEDPCYEDDTPTFVLRSDHEFSPESNLSTNSNAEPQRIARTAVLRKVKELETSGYEETVCEKCSTSDNSDTILLCDKCDEGWHLTCLTPALHLVPEGDWFCPKCQHANLIANMKTDLPLQTKIVRKIQNEEQRKKRLAYVGISLSNVLPFREKSKTASRSGSGLSSDSQSRSGSHSDDRSSEREHRVSRRNRLRENMTDSSGQSSTDYSSRSSSLDGRHSKWEIAKRKTGNGSRTQKGNTHYYENQPSYQIRETRRRNKANYLFNEYDDMIKKAIADEMGISAKNWPKKPDNADISAADAAATSSAPSNAADVEADDNDSSELGKPAASKQLNAKKRRRKFNDLDSEGEFDDYNVETDQEFKMESGSNSNVTEEEDNSASGAGSSSSNDSDFQFTKRTGRTYAHYRSRRYVSNFPALCEQEEHENENEDDDDDDDDLSSNNLRRSRRVRKAPTKYLGDQESDGSSIGSKKSSKKRRVERDSSFEEKSVTSSNESEAKVDCDNKNAEEVDDNAGDNDSPSTISADQQRSLKSSDTE